MKKILFSLIAALGLLVARTLWTLTPKATLS